MSREHAIGLIPFKLAMRKYFQARLQDQTGKHLKRFRHHIWVAYFQRPLFELLRSICTNAIKGSGTAIRAMEKMLVEQANGKQVRNGGVLVVPGAMPFDEWSAAAAIQQAKYMEKDYGNHTDEDEDGENDNA